ncbi:hypothetical protein Hypma_014293 [Hypsizygus marmoreus]|uniref:Uncharacterized protein n=1 Tax=Hypsizygus marmoreus TaxID=39966 RepID=A0A369JA60_HYPMA|nr:hypothetical protein Hypma_014293 [Hypsizygus marmoreus]
MSITPKVLRKMRIIAIPLTRPILAQAHVQKNNAHPSRILTYYQFQISSPRTPLADEEKTTPNTAFDEASPLPPPLLPLVTHLNSQLTLLTQPRHIDSISRLLKLLLCDLDRAFAQHHSHRHHPSQSPSAPQTSQIQEQVLPLLSHLGPSLPHIPHILTQLRTLSALHASAAEFEGGVMQWISTKAANTWAGFGKAEGEWKLKVYQAGERSVDRMEFEELALKGIDPSLVPKIPHPDAPGHKAEGAISDAQTSPPQRSMSFARSLRCGYRGTAGGSTSGSIIPNFPFFFCVWRSWSHYKAYRASQYLQSLLDAGIIIPEPSPLLDAVHKDYSSAEKPLSSPSSSAESQSTPPRRHELLLTRDAVPAILNVFVLKPSAGADLLRAVEQARVRVRSGRDVP